MYRPESMLAGPCRFLQLVLSRKLFPTHRTILVAIAEPRRKRGSTNPSAEDQCPYGYAASLPTVLEH